MREKLKKMEELFKAVHNAEPKSSAPVLDNEWQANLMRDVRTAAKFADARRRADAHVNVFAFRLGWATLGVAALASAFVFAAGIRNLNNISYDGELSLWEIANEGSQFEISLLDENDSDGKDL